jgi:hypothetical protein
LEKTVRYLFERKARGFSAYSEGAFEDVNKALIAGLGSGQFQTAGEVLAAYAKRYLGGSVEGWVEWLNLMSDASKIDLPKAATLFDKLSPESNSCWRVDQLHQRLKMFQADADVRARKEWDAERIQAADAFFAAKEHLYRKCWGLGLTRTIFDIYGNVPDWFKEYQSIKCIHQQAGALSDEAVRCR